MAPAVVIILSHIMVSLLIFQSVSFKLKVFI